MGVTTEKHQGIIEQGNFKQIGVVFPWMQIPSSAWLFSTASRT
jgi:hypothetical protein